MQEVKVWSLGRELRSHVPQDVAKKKKKQKPASQFFLMEDNRHKKKLRGHWRHLKIMSKMNCSLSLVISPGLSFPTSSIHFSLFLSQHFFFSEFLGKKIDVSHVSELGETFLHWHWMVICDMSYPPSICSIHSGPITSDFIFSTSPARLASAMLASKCTKGVPASGPLHRLFFLYQPPSPKSLHPLPSF